MEKEREALRQKQAEVEAKKMAEERRKYTLKVPMSFSHCVKLFYLHIFYFIFTHNQASLFYTFALEHT
jgi:hypothetical protein